MIYEIVLVESIRPLRKEKVICTSSKSLDELGLFIQELNTGDDKFYCRPSPTKKWDALPSGHLIIGGFN